MSERFRFGLIGCGEISVQTSKAVLASQRCQLVHCMDVRKDLAADLAARHGAKATDRLEELLADKDVQAVILACPHAVHAPAAIEAAKAGKHVLGEKPMACTLTEADAMIAAADKAGVQLSLLFPMRYMFSVQKARELVAAGAIGRVTAYQFHAMACKKPSYWEGGYTGRCKSDWRKYLSQSGGGILIMNLVHNLDAFVYILDPRPRRIYAEYSTLATQVEVEDTLSFVMRLEGGAAGPGAVAPGAIVSLDAASAAPGKESYGDRIYGDRGQLAFIRTAFGTQTVAAGRPGLGLYVEESWNGLAAEKWHDFPPPEGYPNSRLACLDAFAEAIQEGREAPIPGPQGRRSLEIIRGAYLSMQRGRPMEFPVKE